MSLDEKISTQFERLQVLNRLRHRLIVLVGIVLLIPSAIGIIAAVDTYRDQVQRARQSTQHFVLLVANYESRFLSQTELILRGLSNEPTLVQAIRDDALRLACQQLLVDTIKPYTAYSAVSLSDAAGTTVCSSDKSLIGAAVGAQSWYRNVLANRVPVIGTVTLSAETSQPVVTYAFPLFDAAGQITGILGLNIRMAWFDEAQRELKLPPTSGVFLLDSAGGVLAGPQLAGRPVRDGTPDLSFMPEVANGQVRTFSGVGADGISRIYSATQLEPSKLVVLFGLPTAQLIAPLRRILWMEIGILALAWMLAIVSASVGTRYLVTRWTDRLTDTAARLTAGDLAARPDLDGAPAELRQLGDALGALATRIGEREADLRTSLSQKHEMLKEIHHRIKNNMQTVVSILSLHARNAYSDDVRLAFSDAQARIQAFALVHRHLYESEDLQAVRADLFITNLCRLLQDATGVSQRQIRLVVDVPEVRMSGEQAAILASFITEVMTNAFKHAFPEGQRGKIKVKLAVTADGDAVLTIADDGVGFTFDQTDDDLGQVGRGTGLTLIAAFAKQIGGTLERSGPPGTRTTLHFKLDLPKAEAAALWRAPRSSAPPA
ncbi:MAG: sensor histidine kinase [Alphaproteobacteria bacterium]